MALLQKKPDPVWYHYMDHNVRHTPDAQELFSAPRHLLFVYDEMKSRHQGFTKTVKFGPTLFPGYANYPTVFTMQGYNLFYHPDTKQVVPLFAEKDGYFPRAKIKGQLHLVTPKLIHWLDIQKGNRLQYRRKKVKLLLPHRKKILLPYEEENDPRPEAEDRPLPRCLQGWRGKESGEIMHILDAFMYVGRPSFWDDELDGGYSTLQCPIQFPNKDKDWLPRYYEYTRTFEEAQRQNR